MAHLRVVIKYPDLPPSTQTTRLDDPLVGDSIHCSLRKILFQLAKQSFDEIVYTSPKRLCSCFLGFKRLVLLKMLAHIIMHLYVPLFALYEFHI